MKLFWPKTIGWKEELEKLRQRPVLPPFHPDVLSFTQALSKRLIKFRQEPELVSLGYWLRKAHIHEMKEAWQADTLDRVVKARGTAFHIAPSNVDTIFVYSWMLSLLAGNRNIIRISAKEQPQTNRLLSPVLELLQDPAFSAVAERTVLCTYDHNDAVTAYLSAYCHTRVVWGGDETVKKVRSISLAPMANELVFPDRFSLAVLNAKAVLGTQGEEKSRFSQQFYNDSFWFDQMACSSPRVVIWIGEKEEIEAAQNEFWTDLQKVIQQKEYELMAATQVQKFATSLWLASEPEATHVIRTNEYSRVGVDQVTADVRERHCGAGLFYEYSASELQEAASILTDKDQTLAYFGFSKQELIAFADCISTRGIDRIVPVGQALEFSGTWDGQNFLRSFMREIVVIG
ncbi:acyl-CoA reductase [Domibacillus enclensis]|uniref:Acyl-CoA reductase n=1 Tax=Domibacillus enclensis TaxID=1017273 RepID=A0A1N6SDZ1_9BACI|nr:acyl-CoA reductase [Domibacillus enclensis]OXS79295.1 acyl-CoA reductase [Domibacillus enclensis]SIQ39186.1 Acyl-CoA reductase (LuxC) [Domibacillus enclensis]